MHDRRRLEEGFELAEVARRLANMIRVGVVAELDTDVQRVRVRYDTDDDGAPILSAWTPWLVPRAGPDRTWWAPEVGEQVVLLSPCGELTQALALPALYSDTHPAPSADAHKRVVKHSDDALFEYDRAAHRYTITLPDDGEMLVTIGDTTLTVNADEIRGAAPEIRWN